MKKIALCFTFVLIISTGAFAGPPGMSLSEVNSKENQAAFTENNKEAPDIGAIGSSVMIASNYLKEDGQIVQKE